MDLAHERLLLVPHLLLLKALLLELLSLLDNLRGDGRHTFRADIVDASNHLLHVNRSPGVIAVVIDAASSPTSLSVKGTVSMDWQTKLDQFIGFNLIGIIEALSTGHLGHGLVVGRDPAELFGKSQLFGIFGVEALVELTGLAGLSEGSCAAIEVAATAFRSTESAQTSLASMQAGALAVVAAWLLNVLEKRSVKGDTKIHQQVASHAESTILWFLAFLQTENLSTENLPEENGDGCLVDQVSLIGSSGRVAGGRNG